VNRITKIVLLFAIGMLIVLAIVYPFRRQIFIAYHKNRFLADGENYSILSGQKPLGPTLFQHIKFGMFKMNSRAESDAMQHHLDALFDLGYLHKQEFEFTNHFTDGTNGQSFSRSMFLTFSNRPIWTARFNGTNKIVVSAPLEDMPKWQKLVAEFDR
jgi:hypothetical protein